MRVLYKLTSHNDIMLLLAKAYSILLASYTLNNTCKRQKVVTLKEYLTVRYRLGKLFMYVRIIRTETMYGRNVRM